MPAPLRDPAPPSLRALAWFDATVGLPAALRVLAAQLGPRRAARVAVALARRARRDPLAGVPRGAWSGRDDELTRRQLRPVLLLDEVARDVLRLDDAARRALLAEVVAEVGARFVARHAAPPPTAAWRAASPARRGRFLDALRARLFNTRTEAVAATDDALAFDVTACRFVELCRAVGRPELAALFCEADARRFAAADSPARLVRLGTLARGAPRCDFRFELARGDADAAPRRAGRR